MAKFITPTNITMNLEEDERRHLTRFNTIIWDCSLKAFVLAANKTMNDFSKRLDDLLHEQFSRNDDVVYGDLDDGA